MKDTKHIKILIALIIILIIGILISVFNGFKLGLDYAKSTRLEIAINKQLSIEELTNLIEPIYNENEFKVEMIGAFKDTIGITVQEQNEELNEQIINKLNETYNTELEVTDIITYEIPESNIYDIIRPYISPVVISFVLILIALGITYKNNGVTKTLLETIIFTILAEILYIIFISIFNIKITQTIIIGAVSIMLFVIIYLTRTYKSNIEEK